MNGQTDETDAECTFQYQDSLPSLPVPELCQTISKYLYSVKPFLTPEEMERTTQIAKQFLTGHGAVLQSKLQKQAKDKRNWLEEWWLNTYLDNREPSMVSVNFGGAAPYLEHFWEPKEGTQIGRAALVIYYTVAFWQLLRKQRLAVHKSGSAPFDMDQFRMLYCTCKIPGENRDTIVNNFKTEEEGPCPSHLIVQCRGRVFIFNTLVNEQLLTPPEIVSHLTFIRQQCEKDPEGPGVSALTAENRTKWAESRKYLMSLQETNATILGLIEDSLFVLSLDDTSPNVTPEDYSEIFAASLTGNPTIRWGDKSYNCLSFANGTFGSNCDHSPFDAMVLVSMCYYIDLQIKNVQGKWKGTSHIRDIPLPEELIFVVDEKILEDIEQAKQQYQKQASDVQIISYAFTEFGKSFIKKRIHPDIFVQLALQLAYYRLHGRPGACYETATTRRFYHGRTETMRPCTMDAVEWCIGMLDPDVPTGKRLELLMKAVGKHHELMTEAQAGKGFDRHLLGLLQIAKEEGLPVPELYTDSAFTKSGGGGNFVLSTSLVGYTTVLGGVVPMVHNGYGFFYRIRDDRIVVACSAWKSNAETNVEELYKALTLSFQEIMQLVSKSQL